jgi:hypothetical protein
MCYVRIIIKVKLKEVNYQELEYSDRFHIVTLHSDYLDNKEVQR